MWRKLLRVPEERESTEHGYNSATEDVQKPGDAARSSNEGVRCGANLGCAWLAQM